MARKGRHKQDNSHPFSSVWICRSNLQKSGNKKNERRWWWSQTWCGDRRSTYRNVSRSGSLPDALRLSATWRRPRKSKLYLSESLCLRRSRKMWSAPSPVLLLESEQKPNQEKSLSISLINVRISHYLTSTLQQERVSSLNRPNRNGWYERFFWIFCVPSGFFVLVCLAPTALTFTATFLESTKILILALFTCD